MITVRDIMTPDPVTVSPETEITAAARLLLDNHINGVPVVDENDKLVGILCQSDLIIQQKRLPIPSLFTLLDGFIPMTSTREIEREVRKIAAVTVQQAMSTDPVSVSPDSTIETVAALMVDKGFHTLPVIQGGRLVGVIGKEDVLRTLVPTETPP